MKNIYHVIFYFFLIKVILACETEIEKPVPEPPIVEFGIIDFFPKTIQPGDTLTITGNFQLDSTGLNVNFYKNSSYDKDTIKIELISFKQTEIKTLVHNYLPNSKQFLLEVKGEKFRHVSPDIIYLKPQISPYFSWKPRIPRVGELVELSGLLTENTDLRTARIRFFDSQNWLEPIRTGVSTNDSAIKTIIVRVPPDAKTGPMEMYTADHIVGNIQSQIEILPRNPLPRKGEWTEMANMGTGKDDYNWNMGGVLFVIGNKAYVVGGHSPSAFGGEAFGKSTVWEYDAEYDSWFQKANFPGGNISYGAAFVIDGIGYVGTGLDENEDGTSRFFAYDPESDTWEKKTDFPGEKRGYSVGFAVAGNGYIGSGSDGDVRYDDFYRYNPRTDSWDSIQPIPVARAEAFAFVINDKAFVGGGENGKRMNDLHMFDPHTGTWLPKTGIKTDKFTGAKSSFTFDNKAFVGFGYDPQYYLPFVSINKIMKYSADTDSWEPFTIFAGLDRSQGVGFAINGVGYFGLGRVSGTNRAIYDLWAYKF